MKPIKIMMGRKSLTASLHNQTVAATVASPGTATAIYNVLSGGTVTKQLNGGGPTTLETWMLTGPNSNFSVFAHVNSGTSPTGSALDTELVLTSSRNWTLTQVGAGLISCQLAVQIRDAVTHAVLASGVISISAESS